MGLKSKLVAAFGTALAIVIGLGAASYYRTLQDDEDQAWVTHTYTVTDKLDAAYADLAQAQTAELNFLLTRRSDASQRYAAALNDAHRNLTELRRLTADNLVQQDHLTILEALVSRRFAVMPSGADLPRGGPLPGRRNLVISAGEEQLSSQMESTIASMRAEEQRLLAVRDLKAQSGSREMKIVLIAGYSMAFLFLIAATILLRHEGRRRDAAEAILRESEERFRLMVSEVKDYGIFMLSPQGRVISWNEGAERIKGYRSEDILGRHFSQFYSREDASRGLPAELLQIAARQGRVEHEGWQVRSDGSVLWANSIITALRDPGGRLQGFVKIIRDMSERRRMEGELEARNAQLLASNQELESFCYCVSHDLRAPLRAIDGFSQALLEDCSARLDDAGKQYLERVRSGTQRMATLIDDLLALSRITRAEIERGAVDLTEMARSIARDLSRQDPSRKVEFAISPDLNAEADPRLMRTVLENLLGNAWKFTSRRAQGRIEFGCTQAEGLEAFFVRDNGAGFDPAHAGRLFGVFQRLHRTTEFPGTGVGLASVQRVIHRHGGRIWAQSHVNQGAAFFFTLVPNGKAIEKNELQSGGVPMQAAMK